MGKERPDRGGKIMKAVLAAANERLLEICGLELASANSAGAADGDETAGGPSQAGPSQAGPSQADEATQRPAGANNKLLLLNKLKNAVVPDTAAAQLVYNGVVEVVLTLILDNGGKMGLQHTAARDTKSCRNVWAVVSTRAVSTFACRAPTLRASCTVRASSSAHAH